MGGKDTGAGRKRKCRIGRKCSKFSECSGCSGWLLFGEKYISEGVVRGVSGCNMSNECIECIGCEGGGGLQCVCVCVSERVRE